LTTASSARSTPRQTAIRSRPEPAGQAENLLQQPDVPPLLPVPETKAAAAALNQSEQTKQELAKKAAALRDAAKLAARSRTRSSGRARPGDTQPAARDEGAGAQGGENKMNLAACEARSNRSASSKPRRPKASSRTPLKPSEKERSWPKRQSSKRLGPLLKPRRTGRFTKEKNGRRISSERTEAAGRLRQGKDLSELEKNLGAAIRKYLAATTPDEMTDEENKLVGNYLTNNTARPRIRPPR